MSNALSIAAVTAVLKHILENGMVRDAIAKSVGDVIVTAIPPDTISVGIDERAQLNLFLYQVSQNRNVDWISQEFRDIYSKSRENQHPKHPPLALDLHYLLTAYGSKDFQIELLLGYAMQLLHQTPTITSDTIKSILNHVCEVNASSIFSQALVSIDVSNLTKKLGNIKLSPQFLNMEDNSRLWSALQTHYRPSASYQASMVLIDTI
ncbi:DUF4255 domain-containing protein [Calothrix rhizosoleniae]|uniref:DUF4255 domain-containing protein n=1 Tax=Calothrix rhizosoleniae TaxID=888997 RepID=UPI000B4A0158|nr:DUF4255 domain-containing protein [Calothrix rhizosoleniae]